MMSKSSLDPDEAELERIRGDYRAQLADVAARRKAADDELAAVMEEFVATFSKVQRSRLLPSKEIEAAAVQVGGMPRATFYRALRAAADKATEAQR